MSCHQVVESLNYLSGCFFISFFIQRKTGYTLLFIIESYCLR
ncbi:MAG: hypothetical protein AVDCRST_MAG96-697 [uncultured Segetibacter sp.]|uniref:Uncharacterized protein n=1 Tax=uncultured Segetibacter sp. TaxID=481133 RepID=A0A6J4RKQ7_9BACT|nr:MAG: hypothetical protein AVDCRST_MAG96-697 [uncultured Segetibacter sp.]